MSFASDTKNEILHEAASRKCCAAAEAAGLIRGCGSILLPGRGQVGVLLTTEYPAVARYIKTLLSERLGVGTSLRVIQPGFRRIRHVIEIKVSHESGAERLLRETGILIMKNGAKVLTDGLSDVLLRKKCCRRACLKGLFLAAGTVSDPEKGYEFELSFTKRETAAAARKLLASFDGIAPKTRERRGRFVVSVKGSEQIRDILAIVGAHRQLLKYENTRIVKDMKNRANRLNNFDGANEDRVLAAADAQTSAILAIRNSVGLDELPGELLDTALARLAHPDASLAELGALLTPRVGKSAVSLRLKKIAAFAATIPNR
ncbi:MAG: DNA-binding protein WhiA [Clostridiales Family XIII bacterium]|jgi:DNA-binding protein WhiA|nr:DNA-binding protein WhiA [Clostridiales Family XIII bacterium]